ncbi:MAG: SpoIIE family protein phosphatase [Gluconacetobacter diazotrophicus]|nr:SpoIIE family protein phosphatase [Gluconacetobacter diazotrophicus]
MPASEAIPSAVLPVAGDARPAEELLALYKGLVEVSTLINAITDFNELLSEIMDVARRVMRAEGSALFLLDEPTDELRLVIARSADGEIVSAHQAVPRNGSVAGWVFEHGESALIPDAYSDPRFYPGVDRRTGYRTRAILCVPLCRRDRPIGALQVLNPLGQGRASFDAADQDALESFAKLAATAIEKLRFLEDQRRRARFEQEMLIATEIQKNFLPAELPSRPDLAFAALYRPALDVGGDFYDVYEVGPDELYFVVGDVAGKGVPAALLMAQSLSILRLILSPGVSPADVLARWNENLCRRSLRGLFVTALVGRIVPSRRQVEFACAGHCAPWIVRGGSADELAVASGPPMAILPAARYPANAVALQPGEWLTIYTDGLTESRDSGGEGAQLGSSGARRLLEKTFASPQHVVATLSHGEAVHRGDSPPQDDLTLLAFGFRA